MTRPLAPRQAALLDAIRTWHANAGIPPTLAELGRMTGITSNSVVAHHLDVLEGRGLIRRQEGIARSIVLVETPPTIPPDVRETLLRALHVDRDEYGRTIENAKALAWVRGMAR